MLAVFVYRSFRGQKVGKVYSRATQPFLFMFFPCSNPLQVAVDVFSVSSFFRRLEVMRLLRHFNNCRNHRTIVLSSNNILFDSQPSYFCLKTRFHPAKLTKSLFLINFLNIGSFCRMQDLLNDDQGDA